MAIKKQVVTITISGPYATGKTYLKHKIGEYIRKAYGFKVEIEELEEKPEKIKEMLKSRKVRKNIKTLSDKVIYKIRDTHLKSPLLERLYHGS